MIVKSDTYTQVNIASLIAMKHIMSELGVFRIVMTSEEYEKFLEVEMV